jgi:hypothetical protein
MATQPCFLSQVTPKQLEKYLDDHPDVPGAYWHFYKDNYLAKGLVDEAAVAQAAKDLNIPAGHFRRIIDRPKSIRPYAAAAADAARLRRKFLKDNELIVEHMNDPYLAKIARFIWDAPRALLMGQHGATPTSTHAMPYLQRVDKWHRWLGAAMRELAATSPKYHDRLQERIEGLSMYKYARDIGKVNLDFHHTHSGLRALTEWNRRAFNAAMIPIRLQDFEAKLKFWGRGLKGNDLDELAKWIGSEVNHSTGTLSPGEGLSISSRIALAPKLFQAGWYKALFDPLKTYGTYWNMFESTFNPNLYVNAAERRANHMRFVNHSAWMAQMFGLLALSDAVLRATGQKQRINWGWGPGGDFSKTDLWRYKGWGWVLRPRGGMESLALFARIIAMAGDVRSEEKRQRLVGQYAEYKFNPAISSTLELATGRTLFGERVPKEMENFLPWLRGKQHTRGQQQLGWSEYIARHGPIWIGGAVHEYVEALRDQGMATEDIHSLIRGLSNHEAVQRAGIAGFSEFFGFGIYKERPPSQHKRRSRKGASFSVSG